MNNGGSALAIRVRRETAHLSVVCASGSLAARNLKDVAAEVERVFGRILKALEIPSEAMLRPHRITVVARDSASSPSGHWMNLLTGKVTVVAQDLGTSAST